MIEDASFVVVAGSVVSVGAYTGGFLGSFIATSALLMAAAYWRRTMAAHRIAAQAEHVRALVLDTNEKLSVLNGGYLPASGVRLAGYLRNHEEEALQWVSTK